MAEGPIQRRQVFALVAILGALSGGREKGDRKQEREKKWREGGEERRKGKGRIGLHVVPGETRIE